VDYRGQIREKQFWMNLQSRYELAVAERELGAKVKSEVSSAA
jgi:plasmid maintenance system antidote protein VapI